MVKQNTMFSVVWTREKNIRKVKLRVGPGNVSLRKGKFLKINEVESVNERQTQLILKSLTNENRRYLKKLTVKRITAGNVGDF